MKNKPTCDSPSRMPAVTAALLMATVTALAGCKRIDEGKVDVPVSGSAGPNGAQRAAASLVKCEKPVATVALVENPHGYSGSFNQYNLPESPVMLVRLLLQQSNCFRVVDRRLGLDATRTERDLENEGMTRSDTTIRRRHVIEAQYTVTPSLTFSETDAGSGIGAILAHIPALSSFAGMFGNVKFKEAQVGLFLTDNETTEQLAASEGSARATDIGLGSLSVGGVSGGLGGFGRTNEGKLITAAFLHAINQLVPQIDSLQAKALPPPVPTRNTGKH